MNAAETYGKIFVVDTNVFFVKRLAEALRQQGFEAVLCPEPAYALTMIEWNMPVAILCGLNPRNSTGFEITTILRADPKTSHIPIIAIGDRRQQSQLESLRAGYADFVDRRLGAEEIAAHLVSFLSSHRDGFQPTQMLARAETALDGRLSLVDLPGVMQVLGQSRQTGGLHINADRTDGIVFFDAGELIHAESGQLVGDDAIIHLVKSCYLTKDGGYKFIPGDCAPLRTVQGSLNAIIMDAMHQLDEEKRGTPQKPKAPADCLLESQAQKLEPRTELGNPFGVIEPGFAFPAMADTGKAPGTEGARDIEAGAQPELKAETKVVAWIEAGIGKSGLNGSGRQESAAKVGNDNPPASVQAVYESSNDNHILTELNELPSCAKVEGQESHE